MSPFAHILAETTGLPSGGMAKPKQESASKHAVAHKLKVQTDLLCVLSDTQRLR